MSYIVFDLESAPLPDDQIRYLMPTFEAPDHYKKEDAIERNIAAQKERWSKNLALSAETGRILVIGAKPSKGQIHTFDDSNEANLLLYFWNYWSSYSPMFRFIGHNITAFDWPFIFQRSWVNNVPIPKQARNEIMGDIWNNDTMRMWMVSKGSQGGISLDRLARLLGIGSKDGSGADFSKLWISDRKKALAYLFKDLDLTEKVYLRLTL